MNFACAYCGQGLEAEENQAGQEFPCPACAGRVIVPQSEIRKTPRRPFPLLVPFLTIGLIFCGILGSVFLRDAGLKPKTLKEPVAGLFGYKLGEALPAGLEVKNDGRGPYAWRELEGEFPPFHNILFDLDKSNLVYSISAFASGLEYDDSRAAWEAMKDRLTEQYGEPERQEDGPKERLTFGQHPRTLSLDFDRKSNGLTIFCEDWSMFSSKNRQQESERKDRWQNAAKKL